MDQSIYTIELAHRPLKQISTPMSQKALRLVIQTTQSGKL